jgi:hypothetical protein
MPPVAGAYPLTGVAKLPNVSIASPGEVWSNNRANGIVIPGAAVAPVNVGGKLRQKQLIVGDTPTKEQVGVALRQVEIPDVNNGPAALGPNEIVNQAIADGDYLRRYMTGVLHLTLVEPRADYVPGQKIGWAVAAARPAGKAAGTGAWSNAAILAGTDIFEVFEYRVFGGSNEGILTVRFLRSNQ